MYIAVRMQQERKKTKLLLNQDFFKCVLDRVASFLHVNVFPSPVYIVYALL